MELKFFITGGYWKQELNTTVFNIKEAVGIFEIMDTSNLKKSKKKKKEIWTSSLKTIQVNGPFTDLLTHNNCMCHVIRVILLRAQKWHQNLSSWASAVPASSPLTAPAHIY